MIKEKYKQLFLYAQIVGIRTIDIRRCCAQCNKEFTSSKLKQKINVKNKLLKTYRLFFSNKIIKVSL